MMTIEQLIRRLSRTYAASLEHRQITLEHDCEMMDQSVHCSDSVLDTLGSILLHAVQCSPKGGKVSLSFVETSRGQEIEIADSSDLSVDDACESSFVIAKAVQDLGRAGIQLSFLDCPQGGVAYSVILPRAARAAA